MAFPLLLFIYGVVGVLGTWYEIYTAYYAAMYVRLSLSNNSSGLTYATSDVTCFSIITTPPYLDL